MRTLARGSALAVFFAAATIVLGADLVVLRGGSRIELKSPPVRQGNVVLLTRSDGTLLSVSASEIDWKATAAARSSAAQASSRPAPAVTAPPETPAEAARAARPGKARVKLTDADVSHAGETESDSAEKEKKPSDTRSGSARLEVADYAQEKSGNDLLVHGSLRNAGGSPATSARMTVTALDDKTEKVASGEAALSSPSVEPGGAVTFSVSIPVGEKTAASIRFAPQWLAPAPPPPVPTPAAVAPAGAKAVAATPKPTPYGQGSLYAAPAPQASTTPPADGNGYLPGMSAPENQPKPPNNP